MRTRQRDTMQRRHCGIHMTVFDKRPHVPVEQRQQQDADVRAVDIGIGHHDDLVVSGLFDVEACAGSCADHLDDGCAFLVGQHLRERCLLHVEDFASNRQQRLETGITGGLGCAQCGITLDDEQFGTSSLPGWQSDSFGGMDADSSAFLRRVTSLVLRACTRACISPTIFSSTRPDCSL